MLENATKNVNYVFSVVAALGDKIHPPRCQQCKLQTGNHAGWGGPHFLKFEISLLLPLELLWLLEKLSRVKIFLN